MIARELAITIGDLVTRLIQRHAPRVIIGVWESAEPADANLSVVSTGPESHRFVPKLSSTGALVLGDTVLLVTGPGVPMTIIGKTVGNINLAEVD